MTRSLTLLVLVLAASIAPGPPPDAPRPARTGPDAAQGRTVAFAPIPAPSEAVAAPTPTPSPGETNAGPLVLMAGTLSYVDPKYGPEYLALPFPRGTVATICAVECVTRRSTDYGPDQRVHPDRIADLSASDFIVVCGVPLSAGLCEGTVELEPPVDPADDAMRQEDGGPAATVPPTSTED